ncbi:Ammonia transport outward protein 2 [Candida viswanathii]|uniref:Ammonia transport outward protein 2 n=1 Tax=Candida viswanathii TaxID=5486 RepID=A0A367Y9G0_9ASCO|nr:Ammonia transport outward protein 2 [Candida viswanathii]
MSSQESDTYSIESLKEVETDGAHLQKPVSRVRTCGDGNEFVIIGNEKYYRHELLQAFGGTLDVGLHPPPVHKIANPSPLGLFAFSLTNLVMGLYGMNAKGIQVANAGVALYIFVAGVLLFVAGIWEGVAGNTFAFTGLISYGCFYLSYGANFIPAFGIFNTYDAKAPEQKNNAIGFLLLGWALYSLMMFLATLKSVFSLQGLFFCIFFNLFLEAIGYMANNEALFKTGTCFGFGVSFFGLFNAWAGMADRTNSYFTIPARCLVEGGYKKRSKSFPWLI